MKTKLVLVALMLCVMSSLAYAKLPDPGRQQATIELPQGMAVSPTRTPPAYTFSRVPTTLLTSYYDYMIGSYNALPLRVIPQSAGGGYFMTYHGQRTPTGTRRIFYSHLDGQGILQNNNEITAVNNREGYPTLAVDPVSGKPLYAWHANADADAQLEVQFVSDAFLSGISGLFNDVQTIVDNPITITSPGGTTTTDNEFIWPSAIVGPSPVTGKRRIYVISRNSVTHSYGPSENGYIRYADFNANDIENGIPLVWSTSVIPEMNQWNVDTTWRRPFHAITCDQAGNLYYAGYHFATTSDGSTNIEEADMDVFKCPNYGQGTWTRVSSYSNLPTWNPPEAPGSNVGYFKDEGGVPYTNTELYWAISNSSHLNATVDDNGIIHVPAIWAFHNVDGSYYPSMQYVKEFTFNPNTQQFAVKEVYPQKNPNNTYDSYYQPWDNAAPWGAVDSYTYIDGYYYPDMVQGWPFPHWDTSLHSDAMMFHYNNIKVTESNGQGMMAVVWQDSQRSRMYNYNMDTTYSNFINTPEIYISVTPDNGSTWSEPIVLNNVETPQFAGLKPMWVYPADKIKYVGMQGNQKIGKLGLMFYNDFTWGSNAISPPAHPTNDGGQVMFTELQIVFPEGGPVITDPFGSPIVLSSSMSIMAGVQINSQMASAGDVVAAFVNVGSTPQLRGKETVMINSGIAGCLIQVFTESNGETVYFKLWDASANEVLNIVETIPSQINGTVGSWPDNLFWLHAGTALQQNINLQSGWNMMSLNVHPSSMQITSIFADIMSNIVQIKSSDGVFMPGNPYNTLTQLTDGKGYFVKVNTACVLSVSGAPIDVATPIPLVAGWNLTGYTPQAAMPVATAIASIASQLIQVKGVEGIYEPGNPYSTLTTLSPGRAYWIKLTGAASLVYPATGRDAVAEQTLPACERWGSPVLKTDSHVVLCELNGTAQAGDLLAAFVDNELRGLSEVMQVGGRLGSLIQVFTDTPGETISFRLLNQYSVASNLTPSLGSIPGGNTGDYATGEYYALKSGETDTPELVTGIVNAYPNPFRSGTSIRLNVAKDSAPLTVEVYNIKGQKVKTLYSGQLDKGTKELYWNSLDEHNQKVASGIYFCRLESGSTKQSIKLMVLK